MPAYRLRPHPARLFSAINFKLYVDHLPCAQIDPDNKELKDLRARSQGLVESFIERVYFPRDAPAAHNVSGAAKACGIGVCAL